MSKKIGRKIYYNVITGDVILVISERTGNIVDTTTEQDIDTFKILSELNRELFDVLILPYGAYSQDFSESNGFKVNVETKEIEFSYPDPSEPELPPVFQPPLTESVGFLGKRLVALEGELMANEVINKTMGSQLIAREFEIFKLQADKAVSDKKISDLQLVNDRLGQQVVQLDIRLMKGGIM